MTRVPRTGFALLALLMFSAAALAERVVIVEPAAPLTDADRAELAARGVIIEQVLGERRYVARVAPGARVAGDARLATMEPLSAEKKIHRGAMREAASGRPWAELNVIFRRDVDFRDAHAAILSAGGTADFLAGGFLPMQRIVAKIPPAALHVLAADERVLTIAGPRRLSYEPDNEVSARLSHVTELLEAPYGLSGSGVAVSLFEGGPADASHVEFGGRLILRNVPDGSATNTAHATHVAATIGAAGVRPGLKGMAPAALIYQFCVPKPSNSCTEDWVSVKATKLAPLGIVANNNSWSPVIGWGSGGFPVWYGREELWGGYDPVETAPLDAISIDTGVLFVQSAGNDAGVPAFLSIDPWKSHRHVDEAGVPLPDQTFCVSQNGSGTDCPATCNGVPQRCEIGLHHPQSPFDTASLSGSAKNVIAVGAVHEDRTVASFSSRGPAKDGRVKPDVVARGVGVLSAAPNGRFIAMSGTSMSAPAVTGIAALLTEQWRRTNNGATPRPEQLKALIIAGAEDLEAPGPDYLTGFGLVNAKNAVDLIIADEGRGRRMRTLTFAAGQSQTHEVAFAVTEPQSVRIVLNWADPARIFLGDETPSAKALVNDLDVRVIDPAGNVHLPWTLNKDDYTAHATRGVNTVDNVEMIEIANAVAGTYRIVAADTSVTAGPQSAVLVANVALARPCFDLQEGDAAYGDLTSAAVIYGALCSAADVDLYKFLVTKTGPVSVTITTGDTAMRATLAGTGIARTQDIPANTTATLNADATVVPNAVTLKLEPIGAIGAEPRYAFTPTFGVNAPPKRRAARR